MTGATELNTSATSDHDVEILELKQAKKSQNFRSGSYRITIYGNFFMIAEKWTLTKMNILGDAWHPMNTWSE